MIATRRFIYIHLHKSGGTFVNECLLRFFPDARQLGYHLPRSLIPPELASLPVLGFVRNPWSYYVSWYSFQSQMAQPNALFRCVSEDRTLGFSGTIRNLLELGSGSDKLDDLVARLPASYGNQGLNLPGFALAPIRNSGKGFYSYLFDYMYGGGNVPAVVGRVENLRADLLDFLSGLGTPIPQPLREFIQHEPPRNRSRHGEAAGHYDAELSALVARRDCAVIEAFGYECKSP